MKLTTDRLILKEITKKDLEKLHELHSIPEVDEFNTLGIPKNIKETKKILKSMLKARKQKSRSSYTWKILLKDSNEFIGLSGMSLSNDRFKMGEIYYKFYPKFWGKGYATEVSRALVLTGFNVFKLHRVEAGVAVENVKSIRVLEKSGMSREGIRRKILPIRGEWVDNYHYAIVEDDPRDF